jgi:hypothetical protein
MAVGKRTARACVVALVALLGGPAAAQAATVTVDDDKLDCPSAGYTSVQAAVNAASPGDVVVICPGLYLEGPDTVPDAGANAVTIHKMLTIRGAGADKVMIRPKPSIPSLLGTTTTYRNGTGAVIGVARSGVRNITDIAGVTVESGGTIVGAGVKFWNSEGSLTASRIRLTGSLSAAQGYGAVVASNLVADRLAVEISGAEISGYAKAGIVLDSTQAAPALGVLAVTVRGNTITGAGQQATAAQQGVLATGLVSGSITGNVIAGHWLVDGDPATTTEDVASAGVRLVDLDLTPVSATNANTKLTATGNSIAGNGFGVRNETGAGADQGYPFTATGNWWGSNGGPSLGLPRTAGDPVNGSVPGPAAGSTTAVNYASARTTPITAPTVPGAVTDLPPTGALDPPSSDLIVRPGTAYQLATVAADDFGVKSVAFSVAGEPLGVPDAVAPYVSSVSWTPPAALDGQDVVLAAVITDSSGQVTTRSLTVAVKAPPPVEEEEETPPASEAPPAQPPAASPPAAVAIQALAPRKLGLAVKARRRTLRLAGRLALPAGASCPVGAPVRVTLTLGKRVVARKTAKLDGDCGYAVTLRAPRRAIGRRVSINARFGGATGVMPKTSAARLLRVKR